MIYQAIFAFCLHAFDRPAFVCPCLFVPVAIGDPYPFGLPAIGGLALVAQLALFLFVRQQAFAGVPLASILVSME
jgi:hypothetical protein